MNLDGRTRLPSGAGFPLAVPVIGAVSISWFAARAMADARAADGWMAALAWVGVSLMPPEWARTHAAYFQGMAEAVIREAGLDPVRIDTGANYVGHDWESALIPIVFPDEQVEHVATRVRDA